MKTAFSPGVMKLCLFRLICSMLVLTVILIGKTDSGSAENTSFTAHPEYKNFIQYYQAYDKAAKKRDFRNAIIPAKKAFALAKKIFGPDSQTVGFLCNGLAYAESATGNHDRAIELYNRALAIYGKIYNENSINIAPVYLNIGEAFRAKGDVSRALEYLFTALKIYKKAPGNNRAAVGTVCNYIGGAYKTQGNYDSAIEYYKTALQLYISSYGENHQFVGTTYVNLGGAYEPKGEYAEAVKYYEKAVSVYEKTLPKDHPFLGVTYNNLGLANSITGEYSEAVKYYRKALNVYLKDHGENHSHTAYAYINLGRAFRSLDDMDTSLDYYNKALSVLENSTDRDGYIQVLSHIGYLYYKKKKYQNAASFYERGIKEILRWRLEIGRGKSGFLNRYVYMFDQLIDIRLCMNQAEGAFRADCMKKGLSITEDMSLKQALAGGKVSLKDQNILLGLGKELEVLISDRSVLLNAGKEDEAEIVLKKIWNSEKTRDIFDHELIQKYPAYAELRHPSVPTVKQIAGRLKPDEVLVSYSIGENRSIAFVITASGKLICISLDEDAPVADKITEEAGNIHTLFKYPAKTAVYTDIRGPQGQRIIWNRKAEPGRYKINNDRVYYYASSSNNTPDISPEKRKHSGTNLAGYIRGEIRYKDIILLRSSLCSSLYARILTPLQKHIGRSKKIILIPDGPLFYVPTGLLHKEIERKSPVAREIVLAHSPAVWFKISQKKKRNWDYPLLAVGNPVYSSGHSPGGSVQRGRVRSSGTKLSYVSSAPEMKIPGKDYSPLYNNLPGTAEEVEAVIKTAYGKSHGQMHMLKNIEANEDRIFEFDQSGRLRKYRIIHFAAHGLFSDDDPSLNAIVLSLPDAVKKFKKKEYMGYLKRYDSLKKDGFLRLGEIKTLDLDCDLVVLSACETSMGPFIQGEGMVGLPQAFLIAGSRNVVASLWPVDDEAAYIFMEEFYRNLLKRGMSPVDALHSAREALKEEYSDPYYWAPFVIYGR